MEACARRVGISAFLTLFVPLLAGCPVGATTEVAAEDQWRAIVKAQHWTPEMPPSTYTHPGLVFALLKDSENNAYRRTLCDDINHGAPPKEDSEVPIALKGKVDLSASVGVDVSNKLLGTGKSADAEAAMAHVTAVTFTPKAVTRLEMASPRSGKRSLPSACVPNLQRPMYLDKTGKYKVPVYVVVEALRYRELTATYDGESGQEISAKLAAASAANVKADVHAKVTGNATLTFTPVEGKSIYIGTHLQQITTLQMLTQIANERVADVTFKSPDFAAVADIGALSLK